MKVTLPYYLGDILGKERAESIFLASYKECVSAGYSKKRAASFALESLEIAADETVYSKWLYSPVEFEIL